MLTHMFRMCNTAGMRSYQSHDARLKMREILSAVERGETVEIKRYQTVTAVVVSPEWYEQAAKVAVIVDLMLEDKAAGQEWQSGMLALREARRGGRVLGNDPANLRIVDPEESQR